MSPPKAPPPSLISVILTSAMGICRRSFCSLATFSCFSFSSFSSVICLKSEINFSKNRDHINEINVNRTYRAQFARLLFVRLWLHSRLQLHLGLDKVTEESNVKSKIITSIPFRSSQPLFVYVCREMHLSLTGVCKGQNVSPIA